MAHKEAELTITPGGRTEKYDQKDIADDILTVSMFIGWHDDNHVMGARTAYESFLAFCRVVDISPAKLRKVVRGDEEDGDD
jgi:hypothetical protein